MRHGWWESPIAVEAIAALAAWVNRYDSGETTRPASSLLYEIERVAALLRDGVDPFDPDRDRSSFERPLTQTAGCRPPAGGRLD